MTVGELKKKLKAIKDDETEIFVSDVRESLIEDAHPIEKSLIVSKSESDTDNGLYLVFLS